MFKYYIRSTTISGKIVPAIDIFLSSSAECELENCNINWSINSFWNDEKKIQFG